MTSSTRPFFSYALWFSLMLVVVNCGPASNQEAPPLLEVSPLSLEFQASQDSLFLEIGNTGGGSLTYPGMELAQEKSPSSQMVPPTEPTLAPSPCRWP